MKKFLICIFCISIFIFTNCKDSPPVLMEREYCTEKELATREFPYAMLSDPDTWNLQYPSGSVEGGMKTTFLTEDFKSKYFSGYKNEDGIEYLRFSLDASDQGKSTNGSSVRAELSNSHYWTLQDKTSLSYSFYLTSTNFSLAKFTVGQFLQHCTEKHSPLCRIEIENGNIIAVVNNYLPDGRNKPDNTHKYSMGSINQYQEVSIKIEIDNGTMNLYRDNELRGTHVFHEDVSRDFTNYYKAGIYYQNKDSPKIFSEIFMRNLEVSIEN